MAYLPLFFPFFIFFAYLLWLCLCCPWLVLFLCLASLYGLFLAFLSLGLLFLFPLRMYAQKERAQSVVLCVLSRGVLFSRSNSCNVVKKLRCRCFGFFQFVRFILPTNTAGVGRLAGSHLNPFRHDVNITDNPPAFLK